MNSLLIKGLQKTSVIDYPEKVCCVIFIGKCDFRCGYCHNRDLVLEYKELKTISEQELIDFLKKRKKWLDGVCITGGEPTIHKELVFFIENIKKLDYLVKIDTNGSNPDMLKTLIDKKLVDYIAIDIKGTLEKYREITNSKINTEKIKKSIELIKNSNIDYEFRMTILPKFHSEQEIIKIGQLLKNSKKFYLQQFRPSEKMIDSGFMKEKPYSIEQLNKFKKILENYISFVGIRE